MGSFPVAPEVGKIGNNSPTFIQPVSERSDGIKSFFQKQQASPAKPMPTSKAGKSSTPTKPQEKPAFNKKEEIKAEVDGIESKIEEGDEEKGLGDDSNAPNSSVTVEEKPALRDEDGAAMKSEEKPRVEGKRKRDQQDGGAEQDAEEEAKSERKGGHQTRVIRRTTSDDSKKAVSRRSGVRGVYLADGGSKQPAITSFFKSPEKVKVEPGAKRKAAPRRGRK